MSSSAYQDYRSNRTDVVRLIDSHGKLHAGTPGKKGLGHITRSGVVMLCAAWELYIESLLVEATKHLANKCQSPDELPDQTQKELAKHVREDKHDLKPLALANDGWRQVLIANAEGWCAGLNTPKARPINDLFHKFIGLPKLSDGWTCGDVKLNEFIGVRGEIAHRGRSATYVPLPRLKDYLTLIDVVAVETDNAVAVHVKTVSPVKKRPWNVTK